AGLEPESHERRAGERLDDGPVRDRRFTAADPRREPLAIARVAPVRRAERAGRARRWRRRDTEVLAHDAAGLAAALGGERGPEGAVRAVGLGRDHDAAGVLVEAMHDAGPQRAAD